MYDDVDELCAETASYEEPFDAAFGTPIVLDTGLHTVKAGFAGETEPKVEIRTVVGRPRHQVDFSAN